MLDKVLKAWECCDPFNRRCFECPYEVDCLHDNFDRFAIADMVKLLKEQQAEIKRLKAEQPKIIRCKDCKYGVKHELDLSNMYECGYPFTIVQEGHFGDFFCAMAEPKEGEKK